MCHVNCLPKLIYNTTHMNDFINFRFDPFCRYKENCNCFEINMNIVIYERLFYNEL